MRAYINSPKKWFLTSDSRVIFCANLRFFADVSYTSWIFQLAVISYTSTIKALCLKNLAFSIRMKSKNVGSTQSRQLANLIWNAISCGIGFDFRRPTDRPYWFIQTLFNMYRCMDLCTKCCICMQQILCIQGSIFKWIIKIKGIKSIASPQALKLNGQMWKWTQVEP